MKIEKTENLEKEIEIIPYIESKFFSIDKENMKKLYIKIKDKITYLSINIDSETSVSIGGGIISKRGSYTTMRIKLFDAKGNKRFFTTFNRNTKIESTISVLELIGLLETLNFTEIDYKESLIPEA